MKKELRDIIPSEKRSIRDIPLPTRKEVLEAQEKKEVKIKQATKESYETLEEEFETVKKRKTHHHKHRSGKGMWAVALISVCALVFVLIWLLAKTTVTVDIKKVSMKFDQVKLLAEGDKSTDATFRFETVKLSTTEEVVLEATGKKEVAQKAGGTVLLYNNFSATPQQLVAGTRIEDPNGLIFKLVSPVTIPGKKTVAGKSVPGSVEVKVIASEAGEKYNLPLTDFTISGFKGTPKFNGFYARSKTEIKGGMFGTVAVVDPVALEEARKNLRQSLVTKAIEKVKAELPEGFLFPEGSFVTSFTSFEPTNHEDSKALLKEEIAIKAFVFQSKNLIEVLAKETNTELIVDQNFNFDISSFKVVSVAEDDSKALFMFDGVFRARYVLNQDDLKKTIAGQAKKEVPKLLTKFPFIEKAQVVVSPFWFSKVTSNSDKIFIVENTF